MLQSRVRAREVGTELYLRKAYDRSPQSADVAYLWALWRMDKGEVGSNLKQALLGLKGKSPQFVDSRLYNENTLYWIWKYHQKVYTALQNEENRIQLIKAANVYLGEFGENSLYSTKIAEVQASLPQ